MAKRKKKPKPIKPTVDLTKPKPHWNGVVLRAPVLGGRRNGQGAGCVSGVRRVRYTVCS